MHDTTTAAAANASAVSISAPLSRRSPAVQRCIEARERTLRAEQRHGSRPGDARQAADLAYCTAMPDLLGQQNIQEFIACVTYGLIIGAVNCVEGPRYLYAAQVARSATPREQRLPGRPRQHTEPQPGPEPIPTAPATELSNHPTSEAAKPQPAPESPIEPITPNLKEPRREAQSPAPEVPQLAPPQVAPPEVPQVVTTKLIPPSPVSERNSSACNTHLDQTVARILKLCEDSNPLRNVALLLDSPKHKAEVS